MERSKFEKAKELYENLDKINEDLNKLKVSDTAHVQLEVSGSSDYDYLASITGQDIKDLLQAKLLSYKHNIKKQIEEL